MKIEPCPFCGVNLVRLYYHKADGGPEWVECANCHAKGDKRALKQDAIDSWNRLSRIVRAAEDWAVADAGYRTDWGCMEWADRLSDARRELRRAVEGEG